MPGRPVAAIVLYELAAPRDPALDEALGSAVAQALRDELALRARRFASLIAPGRAFEATTVGAAVAALHGHDGPVVLVAPDVPRLDEALVPTALADLADGALVVMAQTGDGTPFLVAVRSGELESLELAGASFDRLIADPRLVTAGVGMLRSERRLVTVADALAYLADPLADAELLAHLAHLAR